MKILDEEIAGELLDILGALKVAELAVQLERELLLRFTNIGDRQLLKYEAHMTTSAAGAMGFSSLSDAARRLEHACVSGIDFVVTLKNCVAARNEAAKILASGYLVPIIIRKSECSAARPLCSDAEHS